MDIDQARALLKAGLGKAILEAARAYVMPLYWGTPKNGEWTVDNNGTAFALDCGHGPFLVTAAHVYEAYIDAKSAASAIRCQLGDMAFDLEERRIDSYPSAELDIATFRITGEELTKLGKTVLKGSNATWPPAKAVVGAGAFFAGFPGRERTPVRRLEYVFGIHAALTPVSSASERHFGCAFDRQEWLDIWGKGIPPEGYDLGGISGAPMLLLEQSAAGIYSWRLGGVIYNASTGIGEIVFAYNAKFILPDGRLNPTA